MKSDDTPFCKLFYYKYSHVHKLDEIHACFFYKLLAFLVIISEPLSRLRDRLVKIVTDYRTETSLRHGCNDILKVRQELAPE